MRTDLLARILRKNGYKRSPSCSLYYWEAGLTQHIKCFTPNIAPSGHFILSYLVLNAQITFLNNFRKCKE